MALYWNTYKKGKRTWTWPQAPTNNIYLDNIINPLMPTLHLFPLSKLTQTSLKCAHFKTVAEGRTVERRWYQFWRHFAH